MLRVGSFRSILASLPEINASRRTLCTWKEPVRRKFVDRVRIQVEGGRGGRGVQSWEIRTANKKKRVGASGGDGGHVVIRACASKEDLGMNNFVYNGSAGADASGKGKSGARGRDTEVRVPVGTVVKEVHRDYILGDFDIGSVTDDETNISTGFDKAKLPYRDTLTFLADLEKDGDAALVAQGGVGGMGNRSFGRDEDWPDTPHITGTEGELRFLELELKALADVGLVGYPNAGKSTLLRAISKAQPKVAAYPFTTLDPVIGTVQFDDTFSLRVADIPGLIDGAHENRGLGHSFLRHIERTRVLVYVVDASGTSNEGQKSDALGGDPVGDLKALQRELRLYRKDLPRRPSIVVANKCDKISAAEGLERLRKSTALPVIECSALNRFNVGLMVQSLRWLVETHARQQNDKSV